MCTDFSEAVDLRQLQRLTESLAKTYGVILTVPILHAAGKVYKLVSEGLHRLEFEHANPLCRVPRVESVARVYTNL